MNDQLINVPSGYRLIQEASQQISFSMSSDLQTGCLLRTLAATKPNSRFLELGTGTGLSLAWITEGMDEYSGIISIDNSSEYQSVATRFFAADPRVTLLCADAGEWIRNNPQEKFDLIFADAWPGKYELLDETLHLLKKGGIFLIDDMLPQPNWPEGHDNKAEELIRNLEERTDIRLTKMNWSTGLILIAKI